MTKRNTILALLAVLLACFGTRAKAQKFFNLTADEVRVDSVLPCFSCSLPLEGAWSDSVYTVSIKYPEFLEMGVADVAKCKKISDRPFPAMPDVRADVVVERRRGSLDVSFVPLVVRGGKYMKLVSFMLDVEARPAMSGKTRAAASPADRYAAHSVLATGRWAKIRVPSTGVYEITDALRMLDQSTPVFPMKFLIAICIV